MAYRLRECTYLHNAQIGVALILGYPPNSLLPLWIREHLTGDLKRILAGLRASSPAISLSSVQSPFWKHTNGTAPLSLSQEDCRPANVPEGGWLSCQLDNTSSASSVMVGCREVRHEGYRIAGFIHVDFLFFNFQVAI